jgi:hypothetical protein
MRKGLLLEDEFASRVLRRRKLRAEEDSSSSGWAKTLPGETARREVMAAAVANFMMKG